MGDLTEIQAALPIKIVGASSTGVESNFADVSANLEIKVVDTLNSTSAYSSLTVGTSAVELKVGGSRLANRKTLFFQNTSGGTLFFGFSSSVTTANGQPVQKNQLIQLTVGDSVQVWLIASASGQDVRIMEVG